LPVVIVECCQLEVSATSWSLLQRSPTDCGVSKRDRKASMRRRSWPTGECCAMKEMNNLFPWKHDCLVLVLEIICSLLGIK